MILVRFGPTALSQLNPRKFGEPLSATEQPETRCGLLSKLFATEAGAGGGPFDCFQRGRYVFAVRGRLPKVKLRKLWRPRG